MPIRPVPIHYHCPACGWSKTVAPRSDALGLGDFYSHCPQCQHSPLEAQPAGALQAKVVQAMHTIVRWWKSR